MNLFLNTLTLIAGNGGSFDDGAPRLSGVDVDHLVADPNRYSLSTYHDTRFKFLITLVLIAKL